MSSDKIELSVVVASLDADHNLAACLKAFQEQAKAPNLEIIVVVANASTVNLVKSQFPNLHLIAPGLLFKRGQASCDSAGRIPGADYYADFRTGGH